MRIVTLFLLFFFLSGCGRMPGDAPAQPPAERPGDFLLQLNWATGIMPDPWMQYSYVITIGPGNEGRISYKTGDGEKSMVESFPVSPGDLDNLYLLLLDNGLLSNDWPGGDSVDGGSLVTLSVTAGGQKYSTPAFSDLADHLQASAARAEENAKILVPPDLWDQMNQIQLQHENENE